MATPANSFFVDALRQYGVLEPAQLEEVVQRLQPRLADPKALARELLQRGWITAFQANHLLQKKGHELVLGSFLLLERLGEGGMGQVFKARNRKLNTVVALKVIRKERLSNVNAVKRFYREIRAAAPLSHPNIVHAIDADEVNGTHFLVMEYVNGIDLHKLVKNQGRLDVRLACDLVRQAALGLQHAFERGLVHRDIKPHNLLMVKGAGAAPVAKILDMGLARIDVDTEGDASSSMTQEGAVMGTPDYIAPEQGLDSHNVDTRADLYSLGCTLYFLLTGQPPFPGGTMMEKLLKHQGQAAAPVRQLRPDVPPAVEAITARLMAKRPEQRFQTPAELAAAMANVLSGSAVAAGAGTPAPMAYPVAPAVPVTPGASAADAASTENAFAELHSGNTPSSSSELIQRPTRTRAARTNRNLQIAVGSAAAVLAIAMIALLVRALTGRGTPPNEEPAKVQPKTKKKSALEIALADDKQRHDEPPNEKEREEKRLRAEAEKEQREWLAREEKARKQRAADAESAFEQFETKAKAPGISFASVAKEVQAFKGKHGGTPAAVRAALMLAKLPSPLDALAPAKLPEDVFRTWRARGQEPPGELVGVLGEHRGRQWENIRSLELGGTQRKVIVSRGGNTAYLWSFDSRLPLVILPSADLWALSPDGLWLAAGTFDGVLRVYDVDTGKEAWQVDAFPKSGVRALAFSPDSKSIATGGGLNRQGHAGDNPYTLRFWDVASARLLSVSDNWDNQLLNLKYAPDGSVVAAVSSQGMLGLFDPRQDKLHVSLGTFPGAVTLAFAPDSKHLAVLKGTGGKSVLQVFELSARKSVLKQEDLAGDSGQLAFSPDNRWLMHGENGSMIRIWDRSDFTPAPPWQAHKEGGLTSCLFTKDGKQLWTSSGWNSGEIKVWETGSWKKLKTIAGYDTNTVRQVTALGMSAGGDTIAWSCADGSVRLWDFKNKKVRATFKLNGTGPYVFSPDGKQLVTADLNAVRLWDLDTGKEVNALTGHIGEIASVAVDPYCRLAASLTPAGVARLWNLSKGTEQHAFISNYRPNISPINDLTFTPDGKSLVMVQGPALARLWDVTDPEEHSDQGADNVVIALAVSPDGAYLALGTSGGVVWLRSLGKGGEKYRLNPTHATHSLAFSPDSRSLAIGTAVEDKRQLTLWDLETGRKMLTFLGQQGHVFSVAFSPDGRELASGSSDGTICLWEISGGKMRLLLRGHPGAVIATVYSLDGKLLLSAGQDGHIVIWDTKSGIRLHDRQLHGPIAGLVLAADGRHLISGNSNGTMYVLRVPHEWPVPEALTAEQAIARQEDAAKKLNVPVQVTNELGMKLNLIPAGDFLMGSPEDEAGRQTNESPRHVATIAKPFRLAIHPVTVAQFRRFVKAAKYETEAEKDGRGSFSKESGDWRQQPGRTWRNVEFTQKDDHPLVNVSWNDAVAFCKWLSAKEKKTYRLPSEAEWEYACRAGTDTPFYSGTTLDVNSANFFLSVRKATTRVGAYKPNAFGLYDMHGNASQWCADSFTPGYYRDSFGIVAVAPETTRPAIARGGNWSSVALGCRSAARENYPRDNRSSALGFRVVCDVSP